MNKTPIIVGSIVGALGLAGVVVWWRRRQAPASSTAPATAAAPQAGTAPTSTPSPVGQALATVAADVKPSVAAAGQALAAIESNYGQAPAAGLLKSVVSPALATLGQSLVAAPAAVNTGIVPSPMPPSETAPPPVEVTATTSVLGITLPRVAAAAVGASLAPPGNTGIVPGSAPKPAPTSVLGIKVPGGASLPPSTKPPAEDTKGLVIDVLPIFRNPLLA